MNNKIVIFNFKITNNCNKSCNECCNHSVMKKKKSINFSTFVSKVDDIAKYCNEVNMEAGIGFTGGEPFFYRHEKNNIFNLIDATKNIFPNVNRMVIKTAGWDLILI